MKHNVKKYGFRWRMFYRVNVDGKLMWSEPLRVPFKRTFFMLSLVYSRLFFGPVKRWLYIVLPGIVDVADHNWNEPRRRKT